MRSRVIQGLLLLALLLSAGCGAAKRVAAASVLALESHAVLTQSTFDGKAAPLPKRCDAAKNTSLMFVDAFSQPPLRMRTRKIVRNTLSQSHVAMRRVWVVASMKPGTFSFVALKKPAPICPAQSRAHRV